ncbi:NnrS family protein [Rhodobacter sp. SGA-6-6]|uniref:NnrS family protein n=1 Tax=Rhodobacter sp. SGA-6-6 TaxID=2710882 RepID=UPI0013EA74FD|nr:NnrS family protein [Rhodobacter sp. SGA-6-6]NGM45824.1 NnrS family protein [Rhodobacter sp. SGA-6-6]
MTAPIPNLRGTACVPPAELPIPRPGLAAVISDEGFRLFFPLAALHAALWPFLWVAVQGYRLVGTTAMTPGVWHMHEMIWGSFGAALIGFLTSAFPEWTDTPKLQGRALWLLAGLWGVARVIGLFGLDLLTPVAALADLGWIAGLVLYGARISWQKRTDNLLAFLCWLAAFGATEAVARWHMIRGDAFEAGEMMRLGGLVFLGLLGLALARIAVAVTNLVLDPSEQTSPFRPHPGRLNLAPGLVALAVVAQAMGASPAVGGWLLLAAGAGFIDRMAEGFIGRAALRAEILALSLPAGMAGAGLIWLGAARIGAPLAEAGGWHLALMGGLGLATLAVLSIAGLFHAGHSLPFGRPVKAAMAALLAATACRIWPEIAGGEAQALHIASAALWALAFGLWLRAYCPILSDPETLGNHEGC